LEKHDEIHLRGEFHHVLERFSLTNMTDTLLQKDIIKYPREFLVET